MMERGLDIDDEGRRDEVPVSSVMHAQVLKRMRQVDGKRRRRMKSLV